jgi:phosphoglycerate dehydrogenase-like enzyme
VRIVYHNAAGPALRAALAELATQDLHVTVCPEDDDTAFTAAMADADVLWHVLKPCTEEVIAAAPRLRLIQKIGVGLNTIDLAAAQARGIPVCNLPGTNTRAVAEMTLLLMLAALRRLRQLDAGPRRGAFQLDPAIQDHLGELAGRTVGLVGYGAVPRLLVPILSAMGCRLLYTARTAKSDALGEPRTLGVLLEEADIVSLHVPLTAETERLIDAAAIARMKPAAVLINTARGGLVDQAALTAALASGRLGAAGLDVFVHEPLDPADPLLALDNVVVTPHVAWLTTGTYARSFSIAAENCRRLADGRDLLHRVQ